MFSSSAYLVLAGLPIIPHFQSQYEFMKTNAATINSNLKSFWISMGGKEDIAYNNCKIMLCKFDEMNIKYQYSEYPGGHTWPVWRHDLFAFSQLAV